MKQYLQEASEIYSHEPEDGIRPISSIDAEILQTLSSIVSTLGNRELTSILAKWKQTDDGDVLDELNQFNEEFEPSQKSASVDYITIKDLTVQVKLLMSIQPLDTYDHRRSRPSYRLIINRDEGSKIMFANAEVEFSTAQERDRILQELRERLREFTNIRFL